MGFDNLPFARACRPALTIVSQPTEKIARETAQIMLERLKEEMSFLTILYGNFRLIFLWGNP